MKTERVYAGTIEKEELTEWRQQMKRDGFTALWTWMCWVIRQHVKENYGHYNN